ncbi:MAG: hypothetical protein AM324_013580 [Candidatus Thorarchaeota archaeon SMTZ1-83]|nr:MAG: hypothetical protein AM324_14710 [Candidatus Thorarchaeota archaeon SMTZ1-83]
MVPSAEMENSQRPERNLTKIILLLTLVALLAPAGVMLYSFGTFWFQVQVYALSWMMAADPYGLHWMIDPFALFMMLPMTFLRIVFVVMVIRAYQGKTTRKRATIAGVASELQMPLIYYGVILLMFMITSYYPGGSFMTVIPIPLLLLLGLIIMRVRPPPGEPTRWRDDDRQGYWWEEDQIPEDSERESTDETWLQD